MLILKFLKEECVKAGCDFLAVKDNIDSRSKQTYGILISILSIFAEFDHDAIVEKLTLGRKQRGARWVLKGERGAALRILLFKRRKQFGC